ncbi:unnamed protein product [Aspergillus oryzae RIB40]|uniref:DNA, SC103 n=1 Tax=Aspergillus oryzae (strain ATCC 42149 / RIB 40) TaxID=510516 RepID=Q2TY07_ASPOR|nr:unnamed protein product [Aspergillus oryzae RIB40]BAE65866.1 unnamed protein product [Aspergillus oryzae RIB40]
MVTEGISGSADVGKAAAIRVGGFGGSDVNPVADGWKDGNLKPLDSYFGTDTSGLHREQKRMVALSSPVRYSIEGDGFLFRSCPVLSCWWPEKLTEAQDRKVNNVWKVWRWVVI